MVADYTKRPLLVNLIIFEQTAKSAEELGVVASCVSQMSMLLRGSGCSASCRTMGDERGLCGVFPAVT